MERIDYEYRRNGTRNLFVFCEPKGGWRHMEVTERRTAVDFAAQMRWLVYEAYPDVKVVRVVLDNLNTHKLGCQGRRKNMPLGRSKSVPPGVIVQHKCQR